MADPTPEARARAQQIATDFLTHGITLANVYENCGAAMTELADHLQEHTFANIRNGQMRVAAADAEAAFLVALAIGQALAGGKADAR